MDKRTLEREILTSGYEDSTGLWEIVWYLNRASPETAEAEKISMARSILKELLRRKAVVLYFRDETSDGDAEMAEDAALDVLSVDANWATPDVVGKEYRYMNTEKGDRALSKIWRAAKS